MALDYGNYLHLADVLGAVRPLTDAPDEPLFIIAHQAAELWLKVLLFELQGIVTAFRQVDTFRAAAGFVRCRAIIGVVTKHFDALNTITPAGFAAFRDRLGTSSGAESAQFHELYAFLGASIEGGPHAVPATNGDTMTVAKSFNNFLTAIGSDTAEQDEIIFRLYQTRPDAVYLFERMIDFDAALQEWGFHHALIAARLIGGKPGTGGTSGAEHLRSMVFHPLFTALWRVRAKFYPDNTPR